MGIDLVSPCLAIRHDRKPVWNRAAEWIARLDSAVVLDTGDELFPIEAWTEDAAGMGTSFIDEVRESAHEWASVVRAAVERPGDAGILVMHLHDHRVYMTCGMDAGIEAGDLVDSFGLFGESGIAQAAGFDHWTRYAPTDLSERSPLQVEEDEAVKVRPIQPAELPRSRGAADWIAWFAFERFDWGAARAKVKAQEPEEAEQLGSDLALLHRYLVEDEYSRVFLREPIGAVSLWIAAAFSASGSPIVEAIHRLSTVLVLDAAGAEQWDALAR